MEECIFDYMASHIECRFNKNSLQCYLLAILPAGLSQYDLSQDSKGKQAEKPVLNLSIIKLISKENTHVSIHN